MTPEPCVPQTDASGRELTEHGTTLFPVGCYHDDLNQFSVPWHWHDELEAFFVSEGQVFAAVGTAKLTLRQGEGLFINAGILHSVQKAGSGRCRLHSLVFHPRLAGGSMDSVFWQNYVHPLIRNKRLEYVLLNSSDTWEKEALESIEGAWQSYTLKSSGYEFQVRSALSWLLFLLSKHCPPGTLMPSEKALRDSARAKLMLQYIQEHFSEEISTAQIAACAGISESECLRCFRSIIGVPPVRYLRQYRIQQAAALLASGRQRIAEIGAQCGFSDTSYFTKIFREQTGCTPSEYRRSFTLS